MAELVVYDYNGPGERETAETLAQSVPDPWVVIAGRALPTPQKDDVDLIVVGLNRVFTVEVKHWGPSVEVMNGGWRVMGELRPSPVGRNSQIARITASILRQAIPGYKSASTGEHLITPRVVMSHPKLDLLSNEYPYDDDQIIRLEDAAETLLSLDATPTNFHQVRTKVVAFLSGLSARQQVPTKFGPFTIKSESESVGRARVYIGADNDGESIVLHAYPMDGWGPDTDGSTLVRHERIATRRIAELQRAWPVEATITDTTRRWIILPIRPLPSVSMLRHATAGHIVAREPSGNLTERAARIIVDSFEALAETHSHGVVHRGLSPARVLIGKNDRVLLRDFYLAHASQEATIVAHVADIVDASAPFRAPEVAQFIGAAEARSDVYSMALTLLWWIHGDARLTDETSVQTLPDTVADFGPVAAILHSCLAVKPGNRPSAEDVVNRISELNNPLPEPLAAGDAPEAPPSTSATIMEFTAGAQVGPEGRYRLERVLGNGGFATSWLATDTIADASRVFKAYHDPDAAAAAHKEYAAAARLQNPHCARVWDINPPSAPAYLVTDYIEGESLKAFGESGTQDEEDYRHVALDALAGLAYMHSEDQLHRDVSPNNIIVRNDGRAVLIDFGLTAHVERATSIAGTPLYMAPEVETSGTWTPPSDLYALGVSLLKTMLGRLPYRSENTGTKDKSTLVPLNEEEIATWGATGVAILNALFKLVEPDPADRPLSAAAFAETLRTVSAPDVAPGVRAINPTVASLRRLYRGSSAGNAGNRGLEDDFARNTYVETRLDTTLTPYIVNGELNVVLLTGNPGDGKTAYLENLRTELEIFGGVVEQNGAGGWRMQVGSRSYAALYDASEARDGKSSDELMHEALTGGKAHTALIAVNDGRLLSFFTDYQDVYPDCYVAVDAYSRGESQPSSRVAIVDLKRRSLAARDETGRSLAGDVLTSFTEPGLWGACTGCTARKSCPILANRDLLRGTGREPLLELVEISHLRRKRRATFRDVRSAFAWAITGDRECEEVHAAADDGMDLRLGENALAFDLAFDAVNADYLVAEWALVDPSMLAAPSVERSIRDGSFQLDTTLRPSSHNRQLYFDGAGRSPVSRSEVRAYRYLHEFLKTLAGQGDEFNIKAKVLTGLSRILGAHGYSGVNLALRDGASNGWSVLREIDADEFTVVPVAVAGNFVEQQPDGLRLTHGRTSVMLTLDSFELIRRATDGEILGDAGAEAVKLELSSFGDLLRRDPARRVLVVDPAGRGSAVSVADGLITREDARP